MRIEWCSPPLEQDNDTGFQSQKNNNNFLNNFLFTLRKLVPNILAPVLLVVPNDIPSQKRSIALRIAHDLNKYHKLDSEIVRGSEALQRGRENCLSPVRLWMLSNGRRKKASWHRRAAKHLL
jgi:hypothetical protein